MGENKRAKGGLYEREAAVYLKKQGYVILETNYRCRQGEVDLIAREGETWVFVEVKYRSWDGSGDPSEAVDGKKQRRISRCALYYLTKRGLVDVPCRFDVICVSGKEGKLTWYPNAFDYQE